MGFWSKVSDNLNKAQNSLNNFVTKKTGATSQNMTEHDLTPGAYAKGAKAAGQKVNNALLKDSALKKNSAQTIKYKDNKQGYGNVLSFFADKSFTSPHVSAAQARNVVEPTADTYTKKNDDGTKTTYGVTTAQKEKFNQSMANKYDENGVSLLDEALDETGKVIRDSAENAVLDDKSKAVEEEEAAAPVYENFEQSAYDYANDKGYSSLEDFMDYMYSDQATDEDWIDFMSDPTIIGYYLGDTSDWDEATEFDYAKDKTYKGFLTDDGQLDYDRLFSEDSDEARAAREAYASMLNDYMLGQSFEDVYNDADMYSLFTGGNAYVSDMYERNYLGDATGGNLVNVLGATGEDGQALYYDTANDGSLKLNKDGEAALAEALGTDELEPSIKEEVDATLNALAGMETGTVTEEEGMAAFNELTEDLSYIMATQRAIAAAGMDAAAYDGKNPLSGASGRSSVIDFINQNNAYKSGDEGAYYDDDGRDYQAVLATTGDEDGEYDTSGWQARSDKYNKNYSNFDQYSAAFGDIAAKAINNPASLTSNELDALAWAAYNGYDTPVGFRYNG